MEYIEQLREVLIKRSLTVAVAESVTGGHIQAALSGAEQASDFFQGGVVAYNLGQKSRHLKIDPICAEKCNCVSKEISISMAFGIVEMFSSNIGIGITGYAAPLPEKGIHKIFAWMALVGKDQILGVYKFESDADPSFNVQVDYTNRTIQKVWNRLK